MRAGNLLKAGRRNGLATCLVGMWQQPLQTLIRVRSRSAPALSMGAIRRTAPSSPAPSSSPPRATAPARVFRARSSRASYLRFNYRFHQQTGADFFHTRVSPNFTLATADSDLAPLDAQTVGVKGVVDLPVPFARNLHADVAVERYFRSNDLRVSVYSCGLGLLF